MAPYQEGNEVQCNTSALCLLHTHGHTTVRTHANWKICTCHSYHFYSQIANRTNEESKCLNIGKSWQQMILLLPCWAASTLRTRRSSLFRFLSPLWYSIDGQFVAPFILFRIVTTGCVVELKKLSNTLSRLWTLWTSSLLFLSLWSHTTCHSDLSAIWARRHYQSAEFKLGHCFWGLHLITKMTMCKQTLLRTFIWHRCTRGGGWEEGEFQ